MSQTQTSLPIASSVSSPVTVQTPSLSPSGLVIRRFFRHRMAAAGTLLFTAIVGFVIGGAFFYSEEDSNQLALREKFESPSVAHPFGTDSVGRDILARTIWGGQISLLIGISSVGISISVGTLVGLMSGYRGGWVDRILMHLTDALLSIPTLVLLLLFSRPLLGSTSIVTILGRQFSASMVAIVAIIGLLNWMRLAHIVRAQVMALKNQEFITAAIAVGAGHWRIVFRHILPNCIAPIIVNTTLGVGSAIVTEAYMSFLGFGVLQPTATWGNILTGAQSQLDDVPWVWFFPGLLIILTVLSINFIGDGLRDALDPHSQK